MNWQKNRWLKWVITVGIFLLPFLLLIIIIDLLDLLGFFDLPVFLSTAFLMLLIIIIYALDIYVLSYLWDKIYVQKAGRGRRSVRTKNLKKERKKLGNSFASKVLKYLREKLYSNPLIVLLVIVSALITIFGGITIKKTVITDPYRPSVTSDMEIINALPVNQLIDIEDGTKYFYKNNCPVFIDSSKDHFSWLKDCYLLKFGALGSLGDNNFYFGTYNFSREHNYTTEGIIIFDGNNKNDYLEPVIFRVHLDISPKVPRLGYAEPRIFNTRYGPILEVSCEFDYPKRYDKYEFWGIGHDYKHFLWNSSKWVLLDSYSWIYDLSDRIDKMPDYVNAFEDEPIDLNNLVYTSRLWKQGDDISWRPTGGKVKVQLKIQKDKFVIDYIEFIDNR